MCLSVPGKLIQITESEDILSKTGKVDFGGTTKEVNLAYVPEARIGDYVLVHVGFAITVLNEEYARTVFQYLEEINEINEQ